MQDLPIMGITFVPEIRQNKNALGIARRVAYFSPPLEQRIKTSISEEKTIREALFACDPQTAYALHQTGNFSHALERLYKGTVPPEEELLRRYNHLRTYAARVQQGLSDSATKQELAEFYVETKDPIALGLLIKGYQRIFQGSIRKSIRGENNDTDDLSQLLAQELEKTIERYVVTQGKFINYFEKRMRGVMLEYFRKRDYLTRRERQHLKTVEKAKERLLQQGRRAPSLTEVAQEAGIPLRKIQQIGASISKWSISLDTPIHDKRSKSSASKVIFLKDSIPDTRERVNEKKIQELYDAISRLPKSLEFILQEYFFEERTEVEIGKDMQVSESRVSQLKKEALRQLREILHEE